MAKITFSYPFLTGSQHGTDLITFFAPAKELLTCVSVNQKVEDEDGGYQRVASPARVAAIAKFVDSKVPMPLSILISFERRAVSLSDGVITINKSKKSGWVIDGQHRLIGANGAQTDLLLPVVAFIGLSLDEQIQQFVTVNKEAKGVPTSLYYSLLKKLPPRFTAAELAKERAADISLALKRDETSTFFNRIVSTTSPRNGQLSLVNFVRKIAPLIREDLGILGTYELEEQALIIGNYYAAVRNVFGTHFEKPDSVFFQTIGFGGLFNFFPTVFSATLAEKSGFTVSDITDMLGSIAHIDVEAWKKMGSGNQAEMNLSKDLQQEFRAFTQRVSRTKSTIKLV